MRGYFTLVRRELGSYFASLTGYVIISAALFLIGYSFTNTLDSLNGKPTDMPVTEVFFNSWFFWWILLLAAPLITMRTFALEKATGTFETLTTAPVNDLAIVLAKFTGALLFHMLLWVPWLVCLFSLRYFLSDVSLAGLGVLSSTLLGILGIGAVYMAMGCFASALTRSQIIAAMITFVLGMGLFLLSYQITFPPVQAGWLVRLSSRFSLIDQLQDFVAGVLDTRSLVFGFSLTVFFLYLNWKVLESRRWK
jgi:ABC-2 type transport system permease protein